jgi:alpha-galactosidase
MPRITIIGAGGYVFPLALIRDLLAFPELQRSTITLMDIDAEKLAVTAAAARALIARHQLPTALVVTTDRRAALRDAGYVIITFQVGGLAAYALDVTIPRRYGLDQTVGDTLGPGGVFRALRTIPVLRAIAHEMAELCPAALLIQYANPMAINCWATYDTGVASVGLCHSVQNTSAMLARQIDVPLDAVTYRVAGINHQAWFLEFRRGAEDLYPRIRSVMRARHLGAATSGALVHDQDHSQVAADDSVYEGGAERVRTAIMRTFGYFHTESSHHASEYLPYFRKNPATIETFLPQRWDYYQLCAAHDATDRQAQILEQGLHASHEYGAFIVHSIETNTPRVVYGNVRNDGLISNLPAGCCVEVPCLVDGNGVQPTVIGALPAACAALNRTNINVQELTVHAAIHGDRSAVYQAVALDPLTGALLTLDQIHALVDEMLTAEAAWLPVLR